MDTPTSTPGEQPAATETTTDAGVKPQGDNLMAQIDSLSDEQQLALLDGKPAPQTETTATPAKGTEAQPIEGEQPQPGSGTETKPQPDAHEGKALRLRLSKLTPEKQKETAEAYQMVTDGKAEDLYDALRQMRGDTAEPTETADEANVEEETDPEPTVLESLQSELDALQAELAQAEDDYAGSDVKGPIQTQINKVNREIAKEEMKAELAAEKQQGNAQTYVELYREAVAEVEETYAEAFDTNPNFERILDALKDQAETRKDPRTKKPTFILELAAEAAEMLGITQAATTRTPAPNPPARAAKPVGSQTAPGHTHRVVPSQDQILAGIDSLSIEELAALVDRKK